MFNFGAGATRLLAAFIGLIATVATIAVASGGSSSGPTLPPPPPPEPSGGLVLTVVPVSRRAFRASSPNHSPRVALRTCWQPDRGPVSHTG